MSYRYDVFISYSRKAPVSDWVANHFQAQLEQWVGETALGQSPTIFIDTLTHTGADWPETLRDALRHSRLLVPIWSPRYFDSAWCMAELQTMLARQEHCGAELILPVRFKNGVPTDLASIQWRDFSAYAYAHASFAESVAYLEFVKEIQGFAEEIVRRLTLVPEWDAAWPILEPPDVEPSFNVRMPRL